MAKKKVRRADVEAWITAQTDEERWRVATYREIAQEITEMSEYIEPTTVRRHLCFVMADKLGIEPTEVARLKKEYRDTIGTLPADKLRQLKEWREQGVAIWDCAHRLNIPPSAVEEYCRKLGLP